jgi:hypothetical protein
VKLRRLRINSMPGIYDGYEVEFQDGLTVVEGPNEAGKSTLARAVRSLLWPDTRSDDYVSVSAEFEDAEGSVSVEREGPRVSWTRAGEDVAPPALPDEHLAHSFFIGAEELVDIQARQGKDVAVAIRKQMAGGYDLQAVHALFPDPVKSRSARKAASAYQAADRNARDEEGRQDRIAHEAEQLDALRAKVSQSRSAQREHGFVQAALRLTGKQRALEVQRAQLTEMPAKLVNLSADALEHLDQRLEEREDKQRQKVKLERNLETVQREAAECGLAQPLEARTLAALDEKAGILRETQRKLESAILHHAQCVTAHASARQAVGGQEGVSLNLGDGSEWFELLRQRAEVESERRAMESLLKHLGQRCLAPERAREELEEGARNLRLWLRAGLRSSSATGADTSAFRKRCIGIAVCSLLAAAILAAIGSIYWIAALGLGAGLLVAAALPRAQVVVGEGADLRARAQDEYPHSLDPPSSWEEKAVQDCLQRLTQGLAEWITFEEFEREHSSLKNRLQGLEEQALEQDEQRRDLAQRMGADAELPNAELMTLARGLDRLAQAELALAAATGESEELRTQVDGQLADLGQALEAQGEAPPMEVPTAKPAVEQLKQRSETLARAREAEERIGRDLDRVEEDAQKIAGYIAEIYESAGLEAGDRSGLENLVNGSLPAYLEARAACHSLENSVAEAQEELRGAPEAFAQMTPEDLDEHSAILQERAETLEALQRQVAEITERVKLTKGADSQSELLAQRRDALEDLAVCHNEGLDHLAGRFLMGRVTDRHKRDHAPLVLQRARKLFARFTHQNYELEVARGREDSFMARNNSRAVSLTPAQLSTGTRAQLLLAARIAFVETSQTESPLPIFMDEALDHSDAERFAAIATSLGEVSNDGRQIIYLTNDSTDAALMERALLAGGYPPPHRIDLGELRGFGAASMTAADLELPTIASVPAPEELSAAEYGACIQVPPLGVMRGSAAQHIFYLLEDHLGSLHKLLSAHVETVGQWQAVLRNDATLALEVQKSLSAPPTLEKRALLLDAFCQAWVVGRGMAVDLEALLESGCLSERWHGPLSEIAAELGGDAAAFISALRAKEDPRRKNLRENTIDDLERALQESGHLTDASILDQAEVLRRVLDSNAAKGGDTESVADLVARWWTHAQRGEPTNC